MQADFRVKQAEFAAHIRNPGHCLPPTDVDPRRMAMYCELFLNNIDGFLSSNFPVLRTLLSDTQWRALAQDFFAQHRCQTPHFCEIAEEFLDYLHNERNAENDLPFLLELAHYEWVEMALTIAKEQPVFGDEVFVAALAERPLALSPLAWVLAYQYPVERIGPDFLPTEPPAEPTFLVVYRDASDDVHFMRITAAIYQLLQAIVQQPGQTGLATLRQLPGTPAGNELQTLALASLRQLATKGILIPA